MSEFYRSVLELDEMTTGAAANRMTGEYDAPVSFLQSAGIELHLATVDLNLNFRLKHAVNPLARGHIAFRTDDMAAVKASLDRHGVNYSDYGVWSINNWHQIFFFDPSGNVVEVHEVVSGARSS